MATDSSDYRGKSWTSNYIRVRNAEVWGDTAPFPAPHPNSLLIEEKHPSFSGLFFFYPSQKCHTGSASLGTNLSVVPNQKSWHLGDWTLSWDITSTLPWLTQFSTQNIPAVG